jgi:hypothetical protein
VLPVSDNVTDDDAGVVATLPPVGTEFVKPPVECEPQATAASISVDAAASLPKRDFTIPTFLWLQHR